MSQFSVASAAVLHKFRNQSDFNILQSRSFLFIQCPSTTTRFFEMGSYTMLPLPHRFMMLPYEMVSNFSSFSNEGKAYVSYVSEDYCVEDFMAESLC